MNKFSLTELPNNKMEFDVQGDRAELARMIQAAMAAKQDIREIILAGVIVWAEQSNNNLIEIIKIGIAAVHK